jgi:hypothetical protein
VITNPLLVQSPFQYQLLVTNNGPDAATNVSVTDSLPAGITLSSATPGCSPGAGSGGTITCTLGTVAAGSTRTVILNVTAAVGVAGQIDHNVATATSDTFDPNSSDNTSNNVAVAFTDPPPSCALTATIAGPPKQVQLTAQEPDSGLQSIAVQTAKNATVAVPAFQAGTTSPVVVTATKTDQTASASVTLVVTDVAGQSTTCDPVLATVTGRGVTRAITLNSIDQTEHFVTIDNGTPGLRGLKVFVNGQRFANLGHLSDGQHLRLDVARALIAGKANTISLRGRGKSLATADVLISDS